MTQGGEAALIVGAGFSAAASLLHVAILVGGAPWYRFFGAGRRMVQAATAGRAYPALMTAAIATVLAVWSCYAFAAAGLLPRMPLQRPALVAITTIYLLRGLAAPILVIGRRASVGFVVWSSVVCAVVGTAHLIGLSTVWPDL